MTTEPDVTYEEAIALYPTHDVDAFHELSDLVRDYFFHINTDPVAQAMVSIAWHALNEDATADKATPVEVRCERDSLVDYVLHNLLYAVAHSVADRAADHAGISEDDRDGFVDAVLGCGRALAKAAP